MNTEEKGISFFSEFKAIVLVRIELISVKGGTDTPPPPEGLIIHEDIADF